MYAAVVVVHIWATGLVHPECRRTISIGVAFGIGIAHVPHFAVGYPHIFAQQVIASARKIIQHGAENIAEGFIQRTGFLAVN